MHRTLAYLIVISCCSALSWAGNPAVQLLLTHLHRAQQIDAPRTVEYQFETQIAALGTSQTKTFGLKQVHTADESSFVVDQTPPTKILLNAQSVCSKAGEGWTCNVVDRDTFEQNLKSENMMLYPPTAMYLAEQLITRYPSAVTVSAAGTAKIAKRTCDAFRVAVDGAVLGPAALSQHLYVSQEDGRLLPYVTGTTLQLCFDRTTGHVLEYRNEIVLDQQRMRADGFGTDEAAFAKQPVGVLRGGFVAQRIK